MLFGGSSWNPMRKDIYLEEISPTKQYERIVQVSQKRYTYISLDSLNSESTISKLPYCIRVILENVLRNSHDNCATATDIKNILNWKYSHKEDVTIPFKPTRIIMDDIRGIPTIMEMAAAKDYTRKHSFDESFGSIICPTTLVMCQCLETENYGTLEAFRKNQEIEFQRYKDRFRFIKWAGKTFPNLNIIPPETGSLNHINVELLSETVTVTKDDRIYPDSVIGIGSQTPTVGALGVLGLDVSTTEAQLAMFGKPIYLKLHGVIGLYLRGKLKPLITSTDVSIHIAAFLKQVHPQGKIIEILGSGISFLPVDYRISIANMCPYIGALSIYFPTDNMTLNYLEKTGKPKHLIECIRIYTRVNKLGALDKDKGDSPGDDPEYCERLEIDLSHINTCIAGPTNPIDPQTIDMVRSRFIDHLTKEYQKNNILIEELETKVTIEYEDAHINLKHGDILLAAIEGSLSTCNAYEMIGLGLMARKAVSVGLVINPHIRLLFSPGSPTVLDYLDSTDLLRYINQLGFYTVGFNSFATYQSSCDLPDSLRKALISDDIMAVAVISGQEYWMPDGQGMGENNRVCNIIPATYVMSPQLVLAYAFAGTICTDLDVMPLGKNNKGLDVYLRDIWPSKSQVIEIVDSAITSSVCVDSMHKFSSDLTPNLWDILKVNDYILTYDGVNSGFFFPCWQLFSETNFPQDIFNARILLHLGDDVTTDKIVASGNIPRNSPAGEYLHSIEIKSRQFLTYESRIANAEILARAMFTTGTIHNQLIPKRYPESYTGHGGDNILSNGFSIMETLFLPHKDVMSVHDCAKKYRTQGTPAIIIGGHNFGRFTSEPRDWCAKGLLLLGVKAVIAESYFELNGRALNKDLLYFGILPLQFLPNQNLKSLALSGHEAFSIQIAADLEPRARILVEVNDNQQQFEVICRIDTKEQMFYFKCGGVFNYLVQYHAKTITC